MEIDQLKYFLKIAELRSFTKAAEQLCVSQPALSRSIQKLEAELQRPVFERMTKAVVLTETGLAVESRARQILAIVEDIKLQAVDDGESGTVHIGAIPTIAPYLLPELLQVFSQRFPSAKVVVQEDTTEHLTKRCAQGEIDLAIVALPINERHLDTLELFEEELLVVMPPQHALADQAKVTLRDIEPFPFVLLNEAHCLTDNILSFCRRKSFQPVSFERTNQLATVQELVALYHGISMIPDMARRLDKSKRRLYRSISGPKPTRKIAITWNPYRFQSKIIQRFLNVSKDFSARWKLQ